MNDNPQNIPQINAYKTMLIVCAALCIAPLMALVGLPLYAVTYISLERSGLDFKNKIKWVTWPITIAMSIAILSIIIRWL